MDVPRAPLLAVAELHEDEVRNGLSRLQTAEFLYERSGGLESAYTFKHALSHEVAYGSLLQTQRRMVHARTVEALEQLYSNRLAEHTERLAFHALQGELWDKAAHYAFQAGRRAGERWAIREGAEYGEQGLGALNHVSPSSTRLELSLHLRHLVYHKLHVLGELKSLVPWAEESVGIALAMGMICRMVGNYRRGVEVLA